MVKSAIDMPASLGRCRVYVNRGSIVNRGGDSYVTHAERGTSTQSIASAPGGTPRSSPGDLPRISNLRAETCQEKLRRSPHGLTPRTAHIRVLGQLAVE